VDLQSCVLISAVMQFTSAENYTESQMMRYPNSFVYYVIGQDDLCKDPRFPCRTRTQADIPVE
jgi:hypothetical protein